MKIKTLIIGLSLSSAMGYAQKMTDKTFVIEGKIDTLAYSKYYVSYNKNGIRITDSLQLDFNKEFKYSGNISEPTSFTLEVKNIYETNMVGNLYVYNFWIEPGAKMNFIGGKFKLTASQYELQGSKINELNKLYLRKIWEFWEKDPDSFKQKSKQYMKQFIAENKDSYYSLNLLYSMIRNSSEDEDYVDDIVKKIAPELQQTYLYKDVQNKLTFKVGRKLPDYILFDTKNKEQSLYPFKGKIILVDFWASWCGPCRKLHPHLREMYDLYRSKGFEIVSISLDENKERWLKAVSQDGMNWTSLSDLKGMKKGISKDFLITSIPQSFLIDTNGTILAKVSGFDEKTLSAKLKELLP